MSLTSTTRRIGSLIRRYMIDDADDALIPVVSVVDATAAAPDEHMPVVQEVAMTEANTPYTFDISEGTKNLSLQCTDETEFEYAFGDDDAPLSDYYLLKGGYTYNMPPLLISNAITKLYVKCATPAKVAQLLTWAVVMLLCMLSVADAQVTPGPATAAQVRSKVSGTSGVAYDSATGVFTLSTAIMPGAITLSGAGSGYIFSTGGALGVGPTPVTSAVGTANQVNVSGSNGAVTFSLPQSINSGASPTFLANTTTTATTTNLVLLGASGVLYGNGASPVSRTTNLTGLTGATITGSLTLNGSATFTGPLTLPAGTTTAAPLYLNTTSTVLATPVAGAVNAVTDKMYFTGATGPTRWEVGLNDQGLTAGRVPFATTNGRFTDSPNLTFTGGLLNIQGPVTSTGLGTFANVTTAGTVTGATVFSSGTGTITGTLTAADLSLSAGNVWTGSTLWAGYNSASAIISLRPGNSTVMTMNFLGGYPGRVAINGTASSYTSALTVNTTTGTLLAGVTVNLASGQTLNAYEAKNSSGTNVMAVGPNGSISFSGAFNPRPTLTATSYAITATDSTVISTTTGNITMTLVTPVSITGRTVEIIAGSSGTVTVTTAAGAISTGLTLLPTAGSAQRYTSDGTNWIGRQ